MYGKELIVDMTGVETTLDDVRRLCSDIAKVISVTGLAFHYEVSKPGDQNSKTQGFSAVLFLEESSITVHHLTLLKELYVNVFSCKDFHAGSVLPLLSMAMKPNNIHHREIIRG